MAAEVNSGTSKSAQERLSRIRLLSKELDVIRQTSLERTRSIDTKSSFVVVAAGVLASATFGGLVTPRSWYFGLLPLVLTLASVVAAVIALWPTPVWSPSARLVVDTWVDDPMSSTELEDYILEVKAKEVEHRDARNQKRAGATKVGFVLIVVSLFVSLLVVGLNAAVPKGENLGQVFRPNPSASTNPTQTP